MKLANAIRHALASRTPRERQLILLASAVVVLAALLSLTEWIWTERARMARDLPRSRELLLQMQADANEIQQLERLPVRPVVKIDTLSNIVHAAAVSRGLTVTVAVSADALDVRGSGAFAAVTDWLASMQTQHGLRAERAEFDAGPSAVNFSLTLSPALPR